jgi:hypothetical protein
MSSIDELSPGLWTFKKMLRDCRDRHKLDNYVDHDDFSGSFSLGWQDANRRALLTFYDRWLEQLDLYGEGLWNKIADDGETVGRSRKETFHMIIRIADHSITFYDPKYGMELMEMKWVPQAIEEHKRLAECAEALAAFYRGKSDFRVSYIDDAPAQERAKLYEEEVRLFRESAEDLEAEYRPPRQQRSAKRHDAWARRGFVRLLAENMRDKLGKRYSAAIAVLTDLAFPDQEQVTTEKEVDDICRDRTR